MAHAISGRMAAWVAIPEAITTPIESLPYYQNYYLILGVGAMALGVMMYFVAYCAQKTMKKRGVILV
jgi:POT family proton-dependent oligopeptide transporter